ncbi:3'5'-cyclic nucleotide phosphodiesterase, putative [Eimeria tenella]|uniref:Phosphodiesterase n=1 Tax=Eimeria tenella TaxID=5802 RepID=U6KPT1_EIMTE|nr:3'5'-cyclic nucleotide phosphodiesterase, putative [Eimeria tenella]CDJ37448.1 3'5'-cyclic nucleotide phosphodiesterase, putative [Eimeria tenella]|eukprot:XP_013228286.1 3'5'-cyclic nucleotide phosphodiesterase, putative [Eimeria tenella]
MVLCAFGYQIGQIAAGISFEALDPPVSLDSSRGTLRNAENGYRDRLDPNINLAKPRKRSGDFVLLNRKSGLGDMHLAELETIDPSRRNKCVSFLNSFLSQLQSVPVRESSEFSENSKSKINKMKNGSSGEGSVGAFEVHVHRNGVYPQRDGVYVHRNARNSSLPAPGGVSKTRKSAFSSELSRIDMPLDPFLDSPSKNNLLSALVSEIGLNWSLDFFTLSRLTQGHVLPTVAIQLKRVFLSGANSLPMDESKWLVFCREICIRYRQTPYHNEQHAGTVAHLNVWLLRRTGFWFSLSNRQKLAVVVAALTHDVGHFGLNNSFLINSNHPLAITYNDRAVLENFHASVAFRTILFYSEGAANIFHKFTSKQYKEERVRIIELILETDLSTHFDFLAQFRLQLHFLNSKINSEKKSEIDFKSPQTLNPHKTLKTDPADCWTLAKACIRCADVGHSAVKWEQHYKWSQALMNEFFAQGRQELELGLQVSPVCDEAATDVPKSQIGFLKLICFPLFESLAQADNSGDLAAICLSFLKDNSETWQRISDSEMDWREISQINKCNKYRCATPPM